MKVYDLHDKEGRNFAFEIGNSFIDRSEVARIVKAIPGATLIKKPRTFSWVSEEEFCEWEINGVRFKAWEPFGDNSRYWIGPESAQSTPEIQMIKDAFLRHRPFWGFFKWVPIVAAIVAAIYSFFWSKECSNPHKGTSEVAANCKPSDRNG